MIVHLIANRMKFTSAWEHTLGMSQRVYTEGLIKKRRGHTERGRYDLWPGDLDRINTEKATEQHSCLYSLTTDMWPTASGSWCLDRLHVKPWDKIDPSFLSGVLSLAFYHSNNKSSSHTWSSGPVVSSFSVVIGIAVGEKLLQIDPIKLTVFTGEFFKCNLWSIFSQQEISPSPSVSTFLSFELLTCLLNWCT